MKKKPHKKSHYVHAAERVKFLFSKGKEAFYSGKDINEKYKFKRIEFPKMPVSLKNLPSSVLRSELKKRTSSSSKKPAFKKSTLKLVSDSKNFLKPSLFKQQLKTEELDQTLAVSSAELDPKRVKGWGLKEYLLAVRKLSELQKQNRYNDTSKKYDITLLEEEAKIPEDEKREFDQWQEFVKAKEARYFQIGRVIKFLSD